MSVSTKSDLYNDFAKAKCLAMWNPLWDLDVMSYVDVLNTCSLKLESLRSLPCGELSVAERNFISMVDSWS